MNDIEIKNIQGAISSCEDILKYVGHMNEHIDGLVGILREVNTKWESTGQDKESYMQELTKQVNNLTIISQEVNAFATSIRNGVQRFQEYSNKTM